MILCNTQRRGDAGTRRQENFLRVPASPRPRVCSSPRPRVLRLRGRRAFTLVEVLAAVLLIAIVLPAIMEGISLATAAASNARRRNEAASLAQSQLNLVLASQQWQSGQMSGSFAPDWPDYQWQATVQNWAGDTTGQGIQEIDMEVFWIARNQRQSVLISTLTYSRTSSSSSSSSSSS